MNECKKPPYDEAAETEAAENGETITYTEYDLIDSVSLRNTIDISEYTTQQLTDDIIELCASCTYTTTEEEEAEEEAAEDDEL